MILIVKVLGVILLVALALTVVAAIAVWRLSSIKETPDSMRYGFYVGPGELPGLRAEIASKSRQNEMHLVDEKGDRSLWSSDVTRVESSIGSVEQSTLFVCSLSPRSTHWQAVAADIQQSLVRYANRASASVQMNPDVYRCSPTCFFEMRFPVDFKELQDLLGAQKK